jgi:hypothetical protein
MAEISCDFIANETGERAIHNTGMPYTTVPPTHCMCLDETKTDHTRKLTTHIIDSPDLVEAARSIVRGAVLAQRSRYEELVATKKKSQSVAGKLERLKRELVLTR